MAMIRTPNLKKKKNSRATASLPLPLILSSPKVLFLVLQQDHSTASCQIAPVIEIVEIKVNAASCYLNGTFNRANIISTNMGTKNCCTFSKLTFWKGF